NYRNENPDATDREARRAWIRHKIEVDSRRQDRVDFEDPDPHNRAVQGRYTGDAHFYGELPIEDHHAIPWGNGTYDHQNSPLVRAAGVHLFTDTRNNGPVVNHQGPHSDSYHLEVRARLDTAWQTVRGQGRKAADAALGQVIASIWVDIANGSLRLYNDRNVWL